MQMKPATAVELSELTNHELVQHAVAKDDLNQLELELVLRLESYIELFGDYLDLDV